MNYQPLLQDGQPVIDPETWKPLFICWTLSEAPYLYLDHPMQNVAHDAEMERWIRKARNLIERKVGY